MLLLFAQDLISLSLFCFLNHTQKEKKKPLPTCCPIYLSKETLSGNHRNLKAMKGCTYQVLHGDEDLHARGKIGTGFQSIDDDGENNNNTEGLHQQVMYVQDDDDLVLDVDDAASILYPDFPPLPDFPCMSSSSSSSSMPAAAKAVASSASSSSSSSAVSWAVLRSDAEEDQHHHHVHQERTSSVDVTTPQALSSTASMDISQNQPSEVAAAGDHAGMGVDCMDVMENFGFMDLLDDSNDLFDPTSIFNHDDIPSLDGYQQQQQNQPPSEELVMVQSKNTRNSNGDVSSGGGASSDDDLAMVFLEWLKSNKETVSAEDLRKVKIKKSTIECAAKRLGGGKEAMKQLLKLILEWVQTNHLSKRRMSPAAGAASNFNTNMNNNENNHLPFRQQQQLYQDTVFQNPNPNFHINPVPPDHQPNPCFPHQSSWMAQQSYIPDPASVVTGFPPPAMGYMCDNNISGHGCYAAGGVTNEYQHMLETSQSWPQSQFGVASHYSSFQDTNIHPAPMGPMHPQAFTGYGNQYPYPQYLQGHGGGGGGEQQRLMRMGSSATKEARKKRMARQRRLSAHPRHHHHHSHQTHNNQQGVDQHHQHALFSTDNNCINPAAAASAQGNGGHWVFWPSNTSPGSAPPLPVDRPLMQPQNHQRQQGASDRRQGWKPEKNLRFLLQKVLKQSDVGNLGRIVLPKKEAETHLPELEARDGISIAMEDIGTSRVWNMRYRFWPNNKSRMYLLENTGDFVKANELQEGDFIVIYSDVKCGKYMIRGVKVRQPEPKPDTKRTGKSQRNHRANSPSPSPSPLRQAVK